MATNTQLRSKSKSKSKYIDNNRGSVKKGWINPLLWIQILVVIVSCFLIFLASTLRFSGGEAPPNLPKERGGSQQNSRHSSSSSLTPKNSVKLPEGQKESPSAASMIMTQVSKQANQQPDQLPDGFQRVLQRAQQFQLNCLKLNLLPAKYGPNMIDLPSFGIVDALKNYNSREQPWQQCHAPPSTECGIEKFSVIFLGFSFERLGDVKLQLRRMLAQEPYKLMVEEVILVWNNPVPINSTKESLNNRHGHLLYDWSTRSNNPFIKDSNNNEPNPFRIFYPIQDLGLSSSLMNRYHPAIQPKSRALLYYDDDGPFYVYKAIRSAFELWKRNSDTQMGAMARAFTLSPRQQMEKDQLLGGRMALDDRKFVSHCAADTVAYDYRFFCTFHANMVLPSGSFLHRNYLCFIWHPALAELREFVLKHVVHPDDMTVSTIVSHISGRAPMPYSRRLPEARRRLDDAGEEDLSNDTSWKEEPSSSSSLSWRNRRRLGADASITVNETSPEGMWRTKDWGKLRSIALNSVVSYFGGINSGSFGWCYKTKWHKTSGERHICEPDIAREYMLPWMQQGGFRNNVCPTATK